MQCTEPEEVWEAYNEDAEDPDCLLAAKPGRWKGLHDPRESISVSYVAA